MATMNDWSPPRSNSIRESFISTNFCDWHANNSIQINNSNSINSSGDKDRKKAIMIQGATKLAASTNKQRQQRAPMCSRHTSALLVLIVVSSALIQCGLIGSANGATATLTKLGRFERQASSTSLTTTERGADDSPNTPTTTTTTTTTTASSTAASSAATPAPTDNNTTGQPVDGPAPGQLAKGKYPPVNFTQVNEIFESLLDEPEVVLRWRKMDRTMTEGVRAVLKIVFPHIVSLASDAKVSGNCSGAILKWILNLRNMREWAVKMLDAIGKPNAGLLEGSLTLFGNYKQCLQVRAPDEDEIEINDDEFREYFRGQYCVLQIKPPLPKRRPFYSLNSTIDAIQRKSYKYYEKTVYDSLAELAMAFHFVSIRADLCVPSLCSRDDIQRVADFLVNKVQMRARVQRCDIEPMDSDTQLEHTHLIWSLIFIIILLLVLVSTLTSLAFKINSKRSSTKTKSTATTALSSKSKSIFTSMSLYRSLSHMKNVQMDRINDSKPVFLYAIRLLIILWIFLSSLASQLDYQYLRELLSLRSLIMLWPMQLLVNSTLQFDTLIFLTAFTYTYQNVNANLSDLIKYNASKYSRLMPSIMLMVAVTIITPLLYPNRSPVWHDFVDEPAQVCKSNGLINVLFLQNLLNSSEICLPQTWLFCVEFQLCILSIPIVYLLNKVFESNEGRFKPTSGPILCLIGLAIIGCLVNFINVYRNSLPAAWFLTFPDKHDRELYFSAHLYKTWTHLSTFALGLLAGHLCRCMSLGSFSGRPYGRNCCANLIWFVSITTMGVIIFCTHSWSLDGVAHLEMPIASALYAALAPLLWSICLTLILFQLCAPCAKLPHQRYGCNLARSLAEDVDLVRLGRLSFLAYLINPYVNQFVLAVQEQAIFSSIFMLSHTFIGNMVLTFTLSFAVSALVELPCRRLIKKLLIGPRRHSTNFDIMARQLNSVRTAPSSTTTTTNGAAQNGGQSAPYSSQPSPGQDHRQMHHPMTKLMH